MLDSAAVRAAIRSEDAVGLPCLRTRYESPLFALCDVTEVTSGIEALLAPKELSDGGELRDVLAEDLEGLQHGHRQEGAGDSPQPEP